MDVTFDILVTPAGVVIAAGIITGLVQILKTAIPILDAKVSGALMAFVISAGLYVVTALALNSIGDLEGPNGALNVFLAWLSAATSAIGIKASVAHVQTDKAPVNDVIDE